jgi:hypothetical protein
MTWLRHLSLSQWQQLFSASITELRQLLEFCRDQKGGSVAQLLINGKASITADTDLVDLPRSEAALSPTEDDELYSLGIWVNGDLMGKVASRDQADVQAIVSSGLDYSVVFSVNSGVGTLEMELMDPEG